MKKQLLCLLFLLMTSFVSGQKKYTDYTYFEGQNVFVDILISKPRYQDVDSIVYLTQYANDFIARSYTLIKRSLDGLTDTLEVHEEMVPKSADRIDGNENTVNGRHTLDRLPVYWEINQYAHDGKLSHTTCLESYQSSSSIMETRDELFFQYDQEGRLAEYRGIFYNSLDKNYFLEMVFSFDYNMITRSMRSNDDSSWSEDMLIHISYTDNGYIAQWVSSTDTIIKYYMFNEADQLVRVCSVFSNYISEAVQGKSINGFISAYIEYKYTPNGYEIYDENGYKEREYLFNKDGYCTDIIYYGKGFQAPYISGVEKYVYYKNGQEVSNEIIEMSVPKAYGLEGGLVLDLKQDDIVYIYSLSGSLVKKANVGEGNTTIPLPKGIYIVVIGDISYKVLVR